MVSLGNGIPGNRSGGYFFDEDSDDQSSSEVSPLVSRPPAQDTSVQHVHIVTGYLSAVEAIVLFVYVSCLLAMTLLLNINDPFVQNISHTTDLSDEEATISPAARPDYLVAYFVMVHVAVWGLVGLLDRIVQWRHQVLRRKGYLKFYRKMRNVRRVPFIIVSLSNALMLIFMSLLYFFGVKELDNISGFHAVDVLYIIVGLEVVIVEPCLIYYIVRATMFNYSRQPPDVIKDTQCGPRSTSNSVSAVGFRDGEDLDELLERQADMIRYLQQHNANLGRRILELQSQNLE